MGDATGQSASAREERTNGPDNESLPLLRIHTPKPATRTRNAHLAERRRRLRVFKGRIIRCKEMRRANSRACADCTLERAEGAVAADRDRGEAERDGHL